MQNILPADIISQPSWQVFDLRSPGEFDQGHIPQAANLPLLENDERAQIGTLYKQQGSTSAVQSGIECFAEKCHDYLSQFEQVQRGPAVVYCWRGGMRSQLVAQWFSTMGFDIYRIDGGYKAFRRWVIECLQEITDKDLVVLHGLTGVGKTQLIRALQKDCAVLDFEAYAQHRGSIFGDFGINRLQTQQGFENTCAQDFYRQRSSRKFLVELEGAIGPVHVPHELSRKIRQAPKILLTRDFDERVDLIVSDYAPLWSEALFAIFCQRMESLRRLLDKSIYEQIILAAQKNDLSTAVSLLLKHRYDPCYAKSIKRYQDEIIYEFNLSHEYQNAIEYMKTEFHR